MIKTEDISYKIIILHILEEEKDLQKLLEQVNVDKSEKLAIKLFRRLGIKWQ